MQVLKYDTEVASHIFELSDLGFPGWVLFRGFGVVGFFGFELSTKYLFSLPKYFSSEEKIYKFLKKKVHSSVTIYCSLVSHIIG